MSTLEIYGYIISQPYRTILAYCNLSGIAYTTQMINISAGEGNSERFLSINPFGTIPTIVHDGYSVWESAAIVPYLADAYNIDNQWYPKDIKIRGRINAYLHSHHQGTRDPLLGYLRAKVVNPIRFSAPQLTPETEAPFIEKLNEFYERLAWTLKETGYVARTAGPTIADIFVHSEMASAMFIPLNLEPYPSIKAWFEEIGSIPEVKTLNDEMVEVVIKVFAPKA